MSRSLSAACQVEFDIKFCSAIKRLGSLASPGSYVTFESNSTSLVVTFHGKEVQTRRRFEYPCGVPFSFTIDGKEMLELLRSFTVGTLTVKDKSISFKSGHTKMNRNIAMSAPKPVFPDFSQNTLSLLPQSTFWNAAYASYAAATRSSEEDSAERVSVLLKDGVVSIIATNGLRAVCVEAPTNYSGPEMEYLLHPRIINPLAPMTAKEDAPPVRIGSDGRKYLISFGEDEITVGIPTTESKRSNVETALQAIAPMQSMAVAIRTEALWTFLERAKLLDGGVAIVRPVILTVDSEKGTVFAKHMSSTGDIQDMFEAEVVGSLPTRFPIGISLKNMAETCSHVKSNTMNLMIYGAQLPLTVREVIEDAKILHILLPVRTQQLEDSAVESSFKEETPLDSDTSTVFANDFDED